MAWGSDEHEEHSTRWPRRIMWFGVAAAILLVGGAVLLWSSWQSQLSRRLAEIRARGEPTNLAELDAWYPRPAADADATRLWLSASERLDAGLAKFGAAKRLPILGDGPEPPPPGQPWPEIDVSRRFLADNASALRTLRDAAARGGQARYIDNFGQNYITLLLPHCQSLRTSAQALQLEAKVCAHDGDAHGAAEAIHVGLVMVWSLENEPIWVSQLVHAAMFGMMAHELTLQLPVVEFSDEDLQMLADDLVRFDFAASAKRAMAGERAGGLSVFEDPRSAGMNPWQTLYAQTVRGADEALFLDFMTDYVAATELPWPQLLAEGDRLAGHLKVRITRLHPMTSTLLPALSMCSNAMARCEVQRRLMIVAVAIKRYRNDFGCVPDELAALTPEYLNEVPTDPTSGEPFRYVTDDVGYAIYSPSKRFPTNEPTDPLTSANPLLIVRDPPLPPKSPDAAAEGTDEGEEAASDAEMPSVQPPPAEDDSQASRGLHC